MSRILEDQIRDFAGVFVESLPELDVEEIRTRPRRQIGSPRARAGGGVSRIGGRLVARGPLIGLAAGVVVLMLGLGPMLMFGSNERSGDGGVPGSSPTTLNSEARETTVPGEPTQTNTVGDPDTTP